jgi:calcineurin-like phosphoesterase family protein
MKSFFTSDTHWFHKNIIEYSNQPFRTVDEMNESMIRNWNEVVGINDNVYHIGDFSFADKEKTMRLIDRLNGNIHFVYGNHDKVIRRSAELQSRFVWCKEVAEIDVDDPDAPKGKRRIFLSHYAHRVWNKSHHGVWHLYGHSHGSLPDDPTSRSFDVGVDCHQYYPLSYNEVKAIIKKKDWKPIDHHR